MTKYTITLRMDEETMDNIKEHWPDEMNLASDVICDSGGGYVSFTFITTRQIAQRLRAMLRVFFGLDTPLTHELTFKTEML